MPQRMATGEMGHGKARIESDGAVRSGQGILRPLEHDVAARQRRIAKGIVFIEVDSGLGCSHALAEVFVAMRRAAKQDVDIECKGQSGMGGGEARITCNRRPEQGDGLISVFALMKLAFAA